MSIAVLPRPPSGWRKTVFAQLVERDGARCAVCECENRTTWRKGGTSISADWDFPADEPWLAAKYSIANKCSNLEIDHRVPLHLGGFNRIENLWLLCRDCHKAKTSAEQSTRLKRLGAGRRA